MEQFEYNADGTIPVIVPTKEGVTKSVENLNPFKRVEAETIAWSEGLKTQSDETVGVYVSSIDNNDFIKIRNVDLGKGAKKFEASVATAKSGSIEIRIDEKDGELLGVLAVTGTGGDQNWKTLSTKIKKAQGVHDVYLVFKGEDKDLFNFDWWQFK